MIYFGKMNIYQFKINRIKFENVNSMRIFLNKIRGDEEEVEDEGADFLSTLRNTINEIKLPNTPTIMMRVQM